MSRDKWLWRVVAAVLYGAAFVVLLSVLDEKLGDPDAEP